MNLEGKYIEINKNNVETIITFLYSKGYEWTRQKYKLDVAIYDISDEIHKNCTKLYLIILKDWFYYAYNKPKKETYIDYYILIREEKLKRILK